MSEIFGNETHCLVPSRFCDSLTDVWLRCLQFYPRRGTCKGQGLDVKRRCSEVILLHSNNHGRTRNLSNCQWVSSDICLVELNGVFLWSRKKRYCCVSTLNFMKLFGGWLKPKCVQSMARLSFYSGKQ